MKKIGLLFAILISLFFVINIELCASETDASLNGLYDVYGFYYIGDRQDDLVVIEGSVHEYGYISLRTFYYGYYDMENDAKYYFVFSKATIHGNGKDGIRFFNAKSMKIEYTLYEASSSIQIYSPESQASIGISVSESFTITGSANSEDEQEVSLGYTHSTTTSYDVVSPVVTQSLTDNNGRNLTFNVNFLNYDENDMEIAPYVGEYIFRSSVVFKISNYSSSHLTAAGEDLSYLRVKFTGEIYKKVLISDTKDNYISHTFYNSSGRSL